jgi:hypothetical protein
MKPHQNMKIASALLISMLKGWGLGMEFQGRSWDDDMPKQAKFVR